MKTASSPSLLCQWSRAPLPCRWLTLSDAYSTTDLSQLKDNTTAIDANYFLARFLETEPLLTALGGPVAVDKNINEELDRWQANDTTPLFVFDGCPVKGEDDVCISIGREANAGTDDAWARYARGEAIEAVRTFGQNQSMYYQPPIPVSWCRL